MTPLAKAVRLLYTEMNDSGFWDRFDFEDTVFLKYWDLVCKALEEEEKRT